MNREDARNVFQRPRRTKEQTEMKNTLGEINSRITWGRRTDKWSERQSGGKSLLQNRIYKKEWKKENSLRDLWDNTKSTNIQIIGVPEGEEREKERI